MSDEWDLIGQVGDLIDEANADLPISENQRISRKIIALVRSYRAPNPNERVVKVDTVSFHRHAPELGWFASINVDVANLGEELGRVEVGNQTYVSYHPDVQRFAYGVAWVGDVAVYRFPTVDIPVGANYQVGPFPLVFTVSGG